jgi:predicted ATPase
MISAVRFQYFKALRDVSTSLGRLSVFVGPNASGKTSILEGIHYIAQSTRNDPSSIFSGPRTPKLLYAGPPDGELTFQCSAGGSGMLLTIWPIVDFVDDDQRASLSEEGWHFVRSGSGGEWSFNRLYRGPNTEIDLNWKQWERLDDQTRQEIVSCGSAVLLRLEASRLAAPSYVVRETPRVEYDGEGLASTLLYMKGNDEELFANLERSMQTLIPTVKKIRFRKSKVFRKEVDYLERDGQRTPVVSEREYMGDALVFDTSSGKEIPAHQMSEGTLLLLGMLTVLHGPQQPRVVLIDDLDRALHPRAQRQFVESLRQWLDQRNDLQVIATTHSPYLLDALEPDEVTLTTLNDEGFTACAPLRDHRDFPKWKDEMSPGEFWSAVGEDWVREQAASGAAR